MPVLRNVESMNYAEIELGIAALGDKARKGTLAVEDMDGGTFTISNGGVFGSLMGTPIINPPQSAILGMHATFERPVAIKGQVSNLNFIINMWYHQVLWILIATVSFFFIYDLTGGDKANDVYCIDI